MTREYKYIYTDGSNAFTAAVSGIDPTNDAHLATKYYVDNITFDHGGLTGLGDDDHTQYVPRTGVRGFTSTVSGVYPTRDYHLVTRQYATKLLAETGNIIFGSEFQYLQDLTESQTTSTDYVEKLSLTISGTTSTTISGIPEGDYRIGWSYEWRQSKQNYEFWGRIQIDDTETIFEREISPFVDVNFWNRTVGFYYYPLLASGVHTIDLDFKTSDSSSVSYIKDAQIEFWRVI